MEQACSTAARSPRRPLCAARTRTSPAAATPPARPPFTSRGTHGASRSWCARRDSTPGCRTTSFKQINATPNVDVRTGTEVVGGAGEGRLQQLVIRENATGDEATVAADALFVLIGARPHTRLAASRNSTRRRTGFCSRARTSPTTPRGRSSGIRSCSKRACRGCSRWGMSGTAPSNASPPPRAKARSPFNSSTLSSQTS